MRKRVREKNDEIQSDPKESTKETDITEGKKDEEKEKKNRYNKG